MHILVNGICIIALEGNYMNLGKWWLVDDTRYQKTLGIKEVEVADQIITDINNYYYEDGEVKEKPKKYKLKYSHLNFIERFTEADQIRYINVIGFNGDVSKIDDSSYTETEKNQLKIAKWKFELSTHVDLTDERIRMYLLYLKQLEILVDCDVNIMLTANEEL